MGDVQSAQFSLLAIGKKNLLKYQEDNLYSLIISLIHNMGLVTEFKMYLTVKTTDCERL